MPHQTHTHIQANIVLRSHTRFMIISSCAPVASSAAHTHGYMCTKAFFLLFAVPVLSFIWVVLCVCRCALVLWTLCCCRRRPPCVHLVHLRPRPGACRASPHLWWLSFSCSFSLSAEQLVPAKSVTYGNGVARLHATSALCSVYMVFHFCALYCRFFLFIILWPHFVWNFSVDKFLWSLHIIVARVEKRRCSALSIAVKMCKCAHDIF